MRGRVLRGGALLVLVVVVVLGRLGGGGAHEPADGWRSAELQGLGGWSAVLRHEGVRLRVRQVDAGDVRLLPDTTYVLASSLLGDGDARRLLGEIRRGSRVVAAGPDARALARALGAPVAAELGPLGVAVPAVRTPETRAVSRVARTGQVWPGVPTGLRPLLVVRGAFGGGSVVAATRRVGRGTVVLLPDRGVVDNAGVVQADNAAFAVGIVGRGPVVALRPGAAASVAGLPPRAAALVGLLVLAAGVGLVAHGRRLGPAVGPDEDPTPGRSAYVDALAAVLARTRDRRSAADLLRSRARTVLARRTGLPPDATADDVRTAARRSGLDAPEADAVADDAGHDLQAVGRALARLEGETR